MPVPLANADSVFSTDDFENQYMSRGGEAGVSLWAAMRVTGRDALAR
jgi:hypothetical protein